MHSKTTEEGESQTVEAALIRQEEFCKIILGQ